MLVVARVTRRTKYLWSEVWKEYRMIIKIFFFFCILWKSNIVDSQFVFCTMIDSFERYFQLFKGGGK